MTIPCLAIDFDPCVVTHSAPTQGIPLPFISVGGSNLTLFCVGLIVNVARRAAAAAGEPDSL